MHHHGESYLVWPARALEMVLHIAENETHFVQIGKVINHAQLRRRCTGQRRGDTEQDATDAAMKLCKEEGGAVCKAAVTYEQCGALAVDGKGAAGWGKSPTKAGAEKQALDGCAADSCSVMTSDCNAE